MDLTDTPAERQFRDELREWLGQNHPGPAPESEDDRAAYDLDWHRRLYSGGYVGVTWPTEFGGRGGTAMEKVILSEELWRTGAFEPRIPFVGVSMVGPVLMAHGTEEQKAFHLQGILEGSKIWCQGFSEPEAGSDLAALKTRAVKTEDGWVVNGHKIWTSEAHRSNWCLLLARTDNDAPKHRGLSLFLLDMETDGIDIRPLKQLTGDSDFNEVFFDDVRVPDSSLVGEVNKGWVAAITTLMHERSGIGFSHALGLERSIADVAELCRRRGLIDDPVVQQELARFYIASAAVRQHTLRGLTHEAQGGQPGPEGSLPKLQVGETRKELGRFALEYLGEDVIPTAGAYSFEFMRAGIRSVGGGTAEIQKNIIAERLLGLPKS